MTSSGIDFEAPDPSSGHRALILGAADTGWYQASDRERRERVLPRFRQLLDEWEALGARLVASFDDDYFVAGRPETLGFSIFLVYDVPTVELLVHLMQRVRETVDGVRLDAYLRFEARVGRRLFLVDR